MSFGPEATFGGKHSPKEHTFVSPQVLEDPSNKGSSLMKATTNEPIVIQQNNR